MATGKVNLPGFFNPVRLWGIEDGERIPTSFSEQTLALDLTDYDAIWYIAYNLPIDSTSTGAGQRGFLCMKNETTFCGIWGIADTNKNGRRLVTPSDSGVFITDARFGGSVSNTYGVPYLIYGLRWK